MREAGREAGHERSLRRMDLVIALKRRRNGMPGPSRRADDAPASGPAARDEDVRMLLALPEEGRAEHFEIREAWVERLRATRAIRDRRRRLAEQHAALHEFEAAKRELFRRNGVASSQLTAGRRRARTGA
jgi:hypothetical protein